MKPMKFRIAAPTTEDLFVTILCWYMIGSMSMLIILTVIEWLIQAW
jgi:hypothetical protein